MSSKEAEREEMKEETHDVEDMEQDDLDEEEDSEDEGSWINECLIKRESIKNNAKRDAVKYNTKLSFWHKSLLYIKRPCLQPFLVTYRTITSELVLIAIYS